MKKSTCREVEGLKYKTVKVEPHVWRSLVDFKERLGFRSLSDTITFLIESYRTTVENVDIELLRPWGFMTRDELKMLRPPQKYLEAFEAQGCKVILHPQDTIVIHPDFFRQLKEKLERKQEPEGRELLLLMILKDLGLARPLTSEVLPREWELLL